MDNPCIEPFDKTSTCFRTECIVHLALGIEQSACEWSVRAIIGPWFRLWFKLTHYKATLQPKRIGVLFQLRLPVSFAHHCLWRLIWDSIKTLRQADRFSLIGSRLLLPCKSFSYAGTSTGIGVAEYSGKRNEGWEQSPEEIAMKNLTLGGLLFAGLLVTGCAGVQGGGPSLPDMGAGQSKEAVKKLREAEAAEAERLRKRFAALSNKVSESPAHPIQDVIPTRREPVKQLTVSDTTALGSKQLVRPRNVCGGWIRIAKAQEELQSQSVTGSR